MLSCNEIKKSFTRSTFEMKRDKIRQKRALLGGHMAVCGVLCQDFKRHKVSERFPQSKSALWKTKTQTTGGCDRWSCHCEMCRFDSLDSEPLCARWTEVMSKCVFGLLDVHWNSSQKFVHVWCCFQNSPLTWAPNYAPEFGFLAGRMHRTFRTKWITFASVRFYAVRSFHHFQLKNALFGADHFSLSFVFFQWKCQKESVVHSGNFKQARA